MTGNIVGEEFDEFVFEEIKFRQQTQYSGYDDTRSFEDIKYQNNKNAWVKLASSVEVRDETYVGRDDNGDGALRWKSNNGEGTKKLKKIFNDGVDVSQFLGMGLAKQAILFNGLSSTNSTTKKGDPIITKVKKTTKDGTVYYDNELKPQEITYISGLNMRYGIDNTQLGSQAYGIGGSSMGLQPMPGIIDVSIDSLNRGSIRKANINIIAYNKTQFEIIELLYLRLGYTILLEWGNDKYYTGEKWEPVGTTLLEDFFFKEQGTTQLEVLTKIHSYRRKYKGNYEGFFGRVVNFNWEYTPEGIYNINLQLVTLGDVIESLQVNVPVPSPSVEKLKQDIELAGEEKEKWFSAATPTQKIIYSLQEQNSPILSSAQSNIIGKWLYEHVINPWWWKKSKKEVFSFFSFKDNFSSFTTYHGANKAGAYSFPIYDKIPERYNYFVTFQNLLWMIEKQIIPIIDTGGKSEKQLNIDTNSDTTLVSYFPNQISLDPRICIFKYEFGGNYEVDGNKINLTGVNIPSYVNHLKTYVGVQDKVVYGKLMNLYLNFDFIAQCSEQNIDKEGKLSLFKFLKSICDGINTALGNVNKIEPIIKDDKIITFIDQVPIPGITATSNRKDIVDLEFYGYSPEDSQSNFVKNISFKTEITPELASMITIGTTGGGSSTKNIDATAFSKWNTGLIDRFNLAVSDPNEDNEAEKRLEELIAKYKTEYEQYGEVISYYKPNTTNMGATLVTIKDKKYIDYGGVKGDYTEEEYIARRKVLEVDKGYITQEEYSVQRSSNYLMYLVEAFGGNSNLKILYSSPKDGNWEDTKQQTGYGGYIREFSITDPHNFMYPKFDSEFISRGKGIFSSYITTVNNSLYKNSKNKFPSNIIGFIPVKFNIILDGISGIKIYNKLNINNKYLPYQYPKAFHFLITKVNHKISNNNWETSLDTLSIPITNPNTSQTITQPPKEILEQRITTSQNIQTLKSYSLDKIKKTILSKNYKWFDKELELNIIGIRNSSTGRKVTNLFDDKITLSLKYKGELIYKEWAATVDPGAYWVSNLGGNGNKNGVARLVPGQYIDSHILGLHRGKYQALTQQGKVTVYRDANLNDIYDQVRTQTGVFGVNIHKAGDNSNQIDQWSAGCQVFKRSSDFEEFMNYVLLAKLSGYTKFSYTLLQSSDIT